MPEMERAVGVETAAPGRLRLRVRRVEGAPVVAKLHAGDVIHSFWVPNLHGKKDLIPGTEALIQFRADEAGTYRGQCAEFCGYQHAWMAFHVTAKPEAEYEVLVVVQPTTPATTPEERGWPPGYFDLAGSIDDETFVRPPQGELPKPVELD